MIQETSGLLLNINSEAIRQDSRVQQNEQTEGSDQERQEGYGRVSDQVTLSAQALALARTVNPVSPGAEATASEQQGAPSQGARAGANGPQFLDIRV